MSLVKSYHPQQAEARIRAFWQANQVGVFDPQGEGETFTIDTPPPTVSGYLHLGHVYSYSHTDFVARFWRMRGKRVFYPMGFDDNGLPTERFVEKRRGVHLAEIGRPAFIQQCLQISQEVEQDYKDLWQSLGLSIDWSYSYRTIDENSRRISQWSFLDLYRKGLVYRQEAPAIWCPECQASFAQADLNDLQRETEFVTLPFNLPDGKSLPVATTRPELLAACVAVFVHPDDSRYRTAIGQQVRVPYYNQLVPVLVDAGADPQKGTGVVMCCTFGDSADVIWWHAHQLPRVELVQRDGSLSAQAGSLAGMPVAQARQEIKTILAEQGVILGRQPVVQEVRVHERCDTPVEYLMVKQWFIRLLEHKQKLLDLGEQVNWYPAHMKMRYRSWVENLNWDWCITRQRYYGIPFPVWYCQNCDNVILASEADLPVDPTEQTPQEPCARCGSRQFIPEKDVQDTWATSSMSPQIVGQWLDQPGLYNQVFPYAMRPQAHDIIRTWAFYTIVKSYYHFGCLPWKNAAISGWGIAGEGMGKISKSRGEGALAPMDLIHRYSADAVRYWAASTGPGKDAVISEEKMQSGARLVTKLWNVARFAERFISELPGQALPADISLSPSDHWILACVQILVRKVSAALLDYDYATAKNEMEAFFWRDLADNYLEMAKQRLYDLAEPLHLGAVFTLRTTLFTVLKLFAPFFPFITEEIYQGLFAAQEGIVSIHVCRWPDPQSEWEDETCTKFGETLIAIASAIRRYKSQYSLPLGSELTRVQLASDDSGLLAELQRSASDLRSVSRAIKIEFVENLDPNQDIVSSGVSVEIGIQRTDIPLNPDQASNSNKNP